MRSILPSLPDPKNSPLIVEALKATPKKQKVADDISKIAYKILSQLSYKGRWTIGLKQQINNKTDFVFKAINRHKNAIICRFKPGDNSTCWEVYLNPPAGYLVDQIVTDLRQVPLNGEIIRLPDARSAKTMALGIGKSKPRLPEPPKQPEAVETPVEPPKAIEKIEPPKVSPVESPKAEPTMTYRPLFPYNVQNHLSSKSLLDDSVILNTGLVAVCLGIDPTNHDILRQFAVQIVLQELDLENLVKVNPNYNSALRAAGIIIRGLVNKGWLSRWMSPQRKKTPRVRDTTKGYLLTRTGKEQLEHIIKLHSDKITHNIQERLFRPELVVIQNEIEVNDEEETDDWDSLPSSEPSPSTTKIPVEELVPLVKEFEARKKAIEECDVLIQDCLNSEKEIDTSFETLKNKLLRLKSEQSELEVQLGNLKGQRDKIYNDLQSARSLREEESKVFNNIKTKLGSAFD